MADELSITLTATFTKGSKTNTFTFPATTFDVTGDRYARLVQEVGTSEEALNLGDVGATGGYIIGVNRDATNFVEFRSGTGTTDVIRANAGEPFCFRISPDSAAPYVIADTLACEIEYLLLPA